MNVFSEKNYTCTLIEDLFRPVRLFFLEVLSPCTAIKDCTFIRDIRVGSRVEFEGFDDAVSLSF